MTYSLSLDSELEFEIYNIDNVETIVCEGYDLEDELLALRLSATYSKEGFALLACQALLTGIGNEEFDKQYEHMRYIMSNEKDANNAPAYRPDILGIVRIIMRGARDANAIKNPTLLNFLAMNGNHDLKLEVARNAHTDPNTLLWLSKEKSIEILEAISRNTNVSQIVLEALFEKENNVLRTIILSANSLGGRRRILDEEYLKKLEPLTKKYMKSEIVENRLLIAGYSCDPKALRYLSRDKEEVVRNELLDNPSSPRSVGRRLAMDGSSAIRKKAIARLSPIEKAVIETVNGWSKKNTIAEREI